MPKSTNCCSWDLNPSLPNCKTNDLLFKIYFWQLISECFYPDPPPRRRWWQQQLRWRKRGVGIGGGRGRAQINLTKHSQQDAVFRTFASKTGEQCASLTFHPVSTNTALRDTGGQHFGWPSYLKDSHSILSFRSHSSVTAHGNTYLWQVYL